MSQNDIPERWSSYKRCGKPIEGTRIICFKVPLNRNIQKKNLVKEIWDIKTLLRVVPKLGAVIDLTQSTQYYEPSELVTRNVLYKKIMIAGHEIPPESMVMEFQKTLEDFLKHNEDALVGVHCVHGLNRTGYMVCRYMRDRLKIPAEEAIKRFEVARGCTIERGNYIDHLLANHPAGVNYGKTSANHSSKHPAPPDKGRLAKK